MSAQASRALRLQYLTVGWNLVEGALALIAAGAAASVALLGFGLDSLVECLSAGVMIWRLGAKHRGVDGEKLEAVENRARKLVAVITVVIATWRSAGACRHHGARSGDGERGSARCATHHGGPRSGADCGRRSNPRSFCPTQ